MQGFKFFLTSLFIASLVFCDCVAFAQTKQQSSPVVVSAVAPLYPPSAKAIRLQGDFPVDVEIDRSGKVTSAKVSKDAKLASFMHKVVEEAAERWQFAPDVNAEKKRRVQLTFSFRSIPGAHYFDSTPVFYPPYRIEVRDNTEIAP
jgi:TonB family protein